MALINPDITGVIPNTDPQRAWEYPFVRLISEINGGLDNSNIAMNAGIEQIKIGTATLGYAETTTPQGSITTLVDLASLAVTVNVPPGGRRIFIDSFTNFSSTDTADIIRLLIREGATTLQIANMGFIATGRDYTLKATYSAIPTAGNHTYKLSAVRIVGGGTSTMDADATYPAYIKVTLD